MDYSTSHLQGRTEGSDELFELLKNPFRASFQQDSVWASLGTSVGFTFLIAIAFSFLRPYNSVVYAPKLKHADEAHAPPPLGKGLFAWFSPVVKTKEQDLIRYMGLDATIFLRFTRMCRNIFLSLSVVGCGILIPVNIVMGTKFEGMAALSKITALTTFGRANWAQVICAYAFNIIVAGFLWFNYRKVVQLRRQYFDSPEYLRSLHARTLMINDIPKAYRSDEAISRLIDEVAPTSSFSRTAIARNVKELPQLIAEHEDTVRKLEKYLAKYLKNPDQLPKARPTCKPSKKDPSYGSYVKGQKMDAIEYLSGRIKELEMEIKDIRLSVDKRNAMPYGFASFEDITEAHSIAYACRNKHPQGTTIVLAPRPNDVIWQNMPLSPATRRWKTIVNNLWVAVLTVLWIAPNAMIAIFLVNLANLGLVWKAFQNSLAAHTGVWAVVQGVASPAVTSLIFLLLPIIFRRMSQRAGDRTKTGRERHVTAKLYTFFVFNNLIIFCVFSTIWGSVSSIVEDTSKGTDAWQAILKADIARALFINLCNISPFWVTWLLQRNLGAAVDLAQLWTLLWSSCVRKFSSPTPRELIELTAPPAFDYASYYNYFLYYSTVALAFGTIQPLVLPACCLYFAVDVYLKKYLLLYIFVTKTESGGMFWRVLFNRMVFACILANLVVFLATWVMGDADHIQAYAVVPLPFLMVAFKIYCRRAFDRKTHYFTTSNISKDPEAAATAKSRKSDRLASRYGHPALYKPLMTPMVHANAQNILASIYRGRLTNSNNPDDNDFTTTSGYSDTFALDPMKANQPGKSDKVSQQLIPGFEVVDESHLDFSYFKDRAEFGDDHGAGDIYQRTPNPYERPGTADTYRYGQSTPGTSRAGSPAPQVPLLPSGPQRTRTGMSHYSDNGGDGTSYAGGYATPPAAEWEHAGGAGRGYGSSRGRRRSFSQTREALVPGAQQMSESTSPYMDEGVDAGSGVGAGNAGGSGVTAPSSGYFGTGYGGLPQDETEEQARERERDEEVRRRMADPMDYDYYRGSTRRQNAGWQGWTG